MVRTKADITAGMKFRSSLAYKNHAANNLLAAELLHAQSPTGRIAPVARRTACLFMSHNLRSENLVADGPKRAATLTLRIAHLRALGNCWIDLLGGRRGLDLCGRSAAGENAGHPHDREVL